MASHRDGDVFAAALMSAFAKDELHRLSVPPGLATPAKARPSVKHRSSRKRKKRNERRAIAVASRKRNRR